MCQLSHNSSCSCCGKRDGGSAAGFSGLGDPWEVSPIDLDVGGDSHRRRLLCSIFHSSPSGENEYQDDDGEDDEEDDGEDDGEDGDKGDDVSTLFPGGMPPLLENATLDDTTVGQGPKKRTVKAGACSSTGSMK